ncbi:uncharacterized protein LOC107363213 [Tetranychus urticae]|uniref:F-box domain-containing protein n=1 Tax=Tetranychus urticae TaxID=32264 RepID=T1KDH5_TETUR|nr:uncharacterized protein LOC107363213 [Tetranychus urticae]
MEVSLNSTPSKFNDLQDDSGFISMESSKSDVVLFLGANDDIPSIRLTICEDLPSRVNISATDTFDEPSCSSTHLSPIPTKKSFKPFSSTPRPPYHPVPDQIDLLSGLSQSFPHVIAQILDFLEPEDLCVLSCVSQTCKKIVLDDPSSRSRKEKYLIALNELKQEVGQENWPIKKTTHDDKSESRGVLSEVKNTQGMPNRCEPSTVESELIPKTSANIEPIPPERTKRRRIEPPENGTQSSIPKNAKSKRTCDDKDDDQDSGIFEATTSKGKTKSRKCEPTAGSKASKRHLKRL